MPKGDLFHPERDSVQEFLTVRRTKWTPHVLIRLDGHTLRFSELKRAIPGISQKSLTVALRELERDGIVTRTSFATIPPRVDYALTDMGAEVRRIFGAVEAFMEKRWEAVIEARDRFDSQAEMEPTPAIMPLRSSR